VPTIIHHPPSEKADSLEEDEEVKSVTKAGDESGKEESGKDK
jgi:hypothetical protein